MSSEMIDELTCPLPQPKVHITGHNSKGQAIVQDSYLCPEKGYTEHAFTIHNFYSTARMPVNLNDDVDIRVHQDWVATGNPSITRQNGTVCRYVSLAPGHKPLSHRTQSLDFGIVTDGTVIMHLDDGSTTLLNKGDVVVQRGTWHAWSNPSETQWARMLFVLQDCEPLNNVKEDLGAEGGLGKVFKSTH